jgi:hypothetical protein
MPLLIQLWENYRAGPPVYLRDAAMVGLSHNSATDIFQLDAVSG